MQFADLTAGLNQIKNKGLKPKIAIILGSGLGPLADELETKFIASYQELGLPTSTAPGHAGRLLIGTLSGQEVMVFQGRVHAYEGYGTEQVVWPVRLAKALNTEILLVTNACGGLNPYWQAGDIMLQLDFINHTGLSPLTGPNNAELGPRFPVLFDVYDQKLIKEAQKAALKLDICLREGVYIGIQGPAYATRAELRAYRSWGADSVGMSTVLEVIAARYFGLRVLGLSTITDMAIADRHEHANEQKVLEQAAITGPIFRNLVKEILKRI